MTKHILLIGEQLYELERVYPEPGPVKVSWNLKKPDGTVYNVSSGKFGYACDCGDHVFRHYDDGLFCKHLKACYDSGLLV